MTAPLPNEAIGATAPTSRATFRLIARCADATNRDADTLRLALLARWTDHGGTYELVRRLQALDDSDRHGDRGADARLAVWFSYQDPDTSSIVADGDPVLAGLSDAFRTRLVDIGRPAAD